MERVEIVDVEKFPDEEGCTCHDAPPKLKISINFLSLSVERDRHTEPGSCRVYKRSLCLRYPDELVDCDSSLREKPCKARSLTRVAPRAAG